MIHRACRFMALLQAGVLILEGLDLRKVPPGLYKLVALLVDQRGRCGAGSSHLDYRAELARAAWVLQYRGDRLMRCRINYQS